jgi:ubiquitin C-terminal hydrolase
LHTQSPIRHCSCQVIHIKRFRYSNVSREKLSTDVTFPLTGLDLSPYLSNDRPAAANNKEGATTAAATATNASGVVSPQQNPVYDLAGIANHIGTMNGGHYVSHINVNGGGSGSRWMCFNDERISVANTNTMCGPSAYVLFYRLRENSAT